MSLFSIHGVPVPQIYLHGAHVQMNEGGRRNSKKSKSFHFRIVHDNERCMKKSEFSFPNENQATRKLTFVWRLIGEFKTEKKN